MKFDVYQEPLCGNWFVQAEPPSGDAFTFIGPSIETALDKVRWFLRPGAQILDISEIPHWLDAEGKANTF